MSENARFPHFLRDNVKTAEKAISISDSKIKLFSSLTNLKYLKVKIVDNLTMQSIYCSYMHFRNGQSNNFVLAYKTDHSALILISNIFSVHIIMLYHDHVLMLHLISSGKGSMGLREQKGEDGLSGLPGRSGLGMPGMKGELTGLVILLFVHTCYFSNNFKADYPDAKYNVFRYCKITHICNTRYILCGLILLIYPNHLNWYVFFLSRRIWPSRIPRLVW